MTTPPVREARVWVINLNTLLLILVIILQVAIILGLGVTNAGKTW